MSPDFISGVILATTKFHNMDMGEVVRAGVVTRVGDTEEMARVGADTRVG
jgi:hypothetical protein